MTDEYTFIYAEVRKQQYDEAINLLFDTSNNSLREQFKKDANHSWYLLGDIFFKKENYSESINFFKRSLRTRADDVQALWAVANAYSELARPKLAERYYRKAIQYAKSSEDLMGLIYDLGNALFDQKQYEEAISCYLKVDNSLPSIYKVAQKNINLFKQQ